MKNRIIIIGITLTILCILYLLFFTGIFSWSIPKIENVKVKTNENNKYKIAKQIMNEYLMPYKSILVPYQNRIRDYNLHINT